MVTPQLPLALYEAFANTGMAWGLEQQAITVLCSDQEPPTQDTWVSGLLGLLPVLEKAAPGRSLSLALAKHITTRITGSLGFALRASPHLGAALGRWERYHKVLPSPRSLRLFDAEEDLGLSLTWRAHPALDPLLLEVSLAHTFLTLQSLVEGALTPLRVSLPHTVNAPEEWASFFGVPVEVWTDPGGRLVLPREAETMAVTQSTTELSFLMGWELTETLQEQTHLPLHRRVGAFLSQRVIGEAPTADEASRAFGMSQRTFYRHLTKEGHSYGELLSSCRHQRAKELLLQPIFSLDEVAFLLGFSDSRSFRRAFRRWTGESPSRWRRSTKRREQTWS